MHQEMTLTEVLRDPLIRLMMRADGVSFPEFVALLERAAVERNRTFQVGAVSDQNLSEALSIMGVRATKSDELQPSILPDLRDGARRFKPVIAAIERAAKDITLL